MSEPLELVVRLIPADEVTALREQVKTLQGQLDALQARYNRLEYLYRSETIISLELQNACREHGVPVRHSLYHQPAAPPSP